jgi:hypothetical protein
MAPAQGEAGENSRQLGQQQLELQANAQMPQEVAPLALTPPIVQAQDFVQAPPRELGPSPTSPTFDYKQFIQESYGEVSIVPPHISDANEAFGLPLPVVPAHAPSPPSEVAVPASIPTSPTPIVIEPSPTGAVLGPQLTHLRPANAPIFCKDFLVDLSSTTLLGDRQGTVGTKPTSRALPLGNEVLTGYVRGIDLLRSLIEQQEKVCECKVVTTLDHKRCTATFAPADLKKDDKKSTKGEAGKALKSCEKALEGPCMDRMKGRISQLLEEAFSDIKPNGRHDGYTVTGGPIVLNIKAACVATQEGGVGGEVQIDFCAMTVTLLPVGAGPGISAHEAGHSKIFDEYIKLLIKYLEIQVDAAIRRKKYATTKELESDVKTSLGTAFKAFNSGMGGDEKTAADKKYQQAYEDRTGKPDSDPKADADKTVEDMNGKAKGMK